MSEYTIFYSDYSFDYHAGIKSNLVKNGFEISSDNNGDYDIKTLKGFGDYTDIEREIKTKKDLFFYLKDEIEKIEREEERNRFLITFANDIKNLEEFLILLKKEIKI